MLTRATSPTRTVPPLGVSMRRLRTLSTFCRVAGTPTTTTSKTACSSKKFPTVSPEVIVATARRTSPGLISWRNASARLT